MIVGTIKCAGCGKRIGTDSPVVIRGSGKAYCSTACIPQYGRFVP